MGHIAKQHVKELGGLVNMAHTQELTYRGNAFVVIGGLHGIRIIIHIHSAELVAVKFNAFIAGAFLDEEYRAFRG